MTIQANPLRNARAVSGFTLTEVVVAVGLVAVVFGGILSAYVQSIRRAEWSSRSLAAEALSIRQLEQVRAARWDRQSSPPVDETLQIPAMTVEALDLPGAGGEMIPATNFFSMDTLTLSSNPVVQVKALRVDTVWPFMGRIYTNTTLTYRAPDR